MIISSVPEGAVVDLYAPEDSDFRILRTGGLFWQLREDVEEWLASSFDPLHYEIRLNTYPPTVVPTYEQVITHHTYILFRGTPCATPLQQAMLFKLAWGGE